MCRIDVPFGNHSLNEKTDPIDRFLQALDEHGVSGNFKKILIKHFAENWQSVFRDIHGLEKSLKATNPTSSEADKCVAFLLSKEFELGTEFSLYFSGLESVNSELLAFLNDVKQTHFQDSPFAFYSSGMKDIVGNYSSFVSWLYGEEFCFSKEFFDDLALNSLEEIHRASILWECFNSMASQFQTLTDIDLSKELASISLSNSIPGPLSQNSSEILRSLEFIGAWIKFDAKAGRISYDLSEFLCGSGSPWEKLVLRRLSQDSDNFTSCHLGAIEQNFKRTLYVNADLSHASKSEVALWAHELNNYFSTDIFEKWDPDDLNGGQYSLYQSQELVKFCSLLTKSQVSAWIKWAVEKDFETVLNAKDSSSASAFYESKEKWITEGFFQAWKTIFLETFNNLDIKERLVILSPLCPSERVDSKDFYLQISSFWKSLFSDLIEDANFPKTLIPDWTIAAISQLDSEIVAPYIDKSIGILRGALRQADNTEDSINKYHEQLKVLLERLDRTLPAKGLRHRMLLMRSSQIALSNEALSMQDSLRQESKTKWYSSLKDLPRAQHSQGKETSIEEYYFNLSQQFSEFCLSRLRLRKGEKTVDGIYQSSQAIESSVIWRQGYLKALTELGYDLNGKVHKSAHFIKKSDPSSDVRSIASECYKKVRRKAKKDPSIQDMKRGIIAAEWWLLLCQRKELKLEVNHETSLKTRRNLMRNP